MESHKVMMELIRELGDPDHLINSDRLIILKLDRLWTVAESVPEDVVFDSDARRFTMSQEAFMSNGAFFAKLQFVAAAFAGCPEFSTPTPAFLYMAKDVLQGVRTLVIMHNRNCIRDLVAWFPTVTSLVLYHDLKLHVNQDFEQDISPRMRRLERLLGTTPALGCDYLFLCPTTVTNLLTSFPKLSMVGTPIPDFVLSSITNLPIPSPLFKECSQLVLGCTLSRRDNKRLTIDAVSPVSISIAQRCFPSVTSLEVTFVSTETLTQVAHFAGLTDLTLISSTEVPNHPFGSHVEKVLSQLPLKNLSLTKFRAVSVPAIAINCPGLESLALIAGSARDEYIATPLFSRLRRLRLSCSMHQPMLLALLRACPDLQELHLEDDRLSGAFLTGPGFLSSPRPILSQVERLTLRTRPPGCNSVVDCRVSSSDLDAALAALPALRRVRTDNFKIRHHLEENKAVRREPITLEWCACNTCFTEYPKVSPQQQEVWANVHYRRDWQLLGTMP